VGESGAEVDVLLVEDSGTDAKLIVHQPRQREVLQLIGIAEE
jgi:hypothetical protein